MHTLLPPPAGQALLPLLQARLPLFLRSLQALRDPAVRAELLREGSALSPVCGPILTMLDDPGFQARAAGLQEAGSEADARARQDELARYLQDRFPGAAAALREHRRGRARTEAPVAAGHSGAPDPSRPERFEEHLHMVWTIVQQWVVVLVYPDGYPSECAAAGAPPGPAAWFTPRALSLITTHRCTAACEHCCFSCSPAADKAIPIPRLQQLPGGAGGQPGPGTHHLLRADPGAHPGPPCGQAEGPDPR